jgi:hypothetical protein
MRIIYAETYASLSSQSLNRKPDLLSASFIKSRIDSISDTEYGEVETLEVKESTRIQHATRKRRINCIPIPLLRRAPSNSFDAFAGNLRVGSCVGRPGIVG